MTTQDLHKHFMVEYDKYGGNTSYPLFLPEEIDIWLNKANNMLINQKLTGNNIRRIAFEGDTKRIADLQGLIKNTSLTTHTNASYVSNAIIFDLSTIPDYLFYIVSSINLHESIPSEVTLVTHEVAKRAAHTEVNVPWLPKTIASIANNKLTVYYDDIKYPIIQASVRLYLEYLKTPAVIDIKLPTAVYELSNNVAYELVNLAVLLALENIESDRLDSKGKTIMIQE